MESELYGIIPEEELRDKLSSGFCELDFTFMGFEDVYKVIRDHVPTDYVICDMGCYMAAQSYYFQQHAGYIGVDSFDRRRFADYVPPKRFHGHMFTEHYSMTIQEFLESNVFKYLDLEKTYFIASYVPDFEATGLMLNKVLNGAVVYCDDVQTKGINAMEIAEEMRWHDYMPETNKPLLAEVRFDDGDELTAYGHWDGSWHLYHWEEGVLVKGFDVLRWRYVC